MTVIIDDTQYHQTVSRMITLVDCPRQSQEEQELGELVEVVQNYQNKLGVSVCFDRVWLT